MVAEMGDLAVEQHMIACVHQSLSLYLMDNARFMCERLVAEFPSEVGLAAHWLTPLKNSFVTICQLLRLAQSAVDAFVCKA